MTWGGAYKLRRRGSGSPPRPRAIRAVNRLNNAPYHRWSSWESIAAGPAILQVGQDQRLFYLFLRKATPADPTDERAEPEFAASVSLVRTQRYETFRGDS